MTVIANWLNNTFYTFDYYWLELGHKLHQSGVGGFFDVLFKFITSLGHAGMIFIVLGIVLLFFKKTRKMGFGVLFALLFGLLFTNICIKPIVARPRPYVDETLIFHQWWLSVNGLISSEYSFPSGHTTAAFAAMTAVFLYGNKKISWTAYIFALIMGFTRVYLCVHYPSDILGGIIIGVISSILSFYFINYIYKISKGKFENFLKNADIIEYIKENKMAKLVM